MKISLDTTLLRQAESFAYGLEVMSKFRKAARLRRFPMKLIDQARTWGVTPPAKA